MYKDSNLSGFNGPILWVVGDASGDMAATLTSLPIYLGRGAGLSVTLYAASDTHVGTLTAQVCDNADGSEHWNSFDIGTVAASNGSAFNFRKDIGTSAAKIRFIYTASSGAGTLTGAYTVKEAPASVDTELTITGTGLALETGGNLAATATVLGTTADASIDADAAGTIKGALRGLAKAFFARIPVIGQQTAAASMSVVPTSDGFTVTLSTEGLTILSPTLDTVAYRSVSGVAAETGALSAGTYELMADVTCWYRINTATGGSAAVVQTTPARLLMAGDKVHEIIAANGCINAITTGATGVLGYSKVL